MCWARFNKDDVKQQKKSSGSHQRSRKRFSDCSICTRDLLKLPLTPHRGSTVQRHVTLRETSSQHRGQEDTNVSPPPGAGLIQHLQDSEQIQDAPRRSGAKVNGRWRHHQGVCEAERRKISGEQRSETIHLLLCHFPLSDVHFVSSSLPSASSSPQPQLQPRVSQHPDCSKLNSLTQQSGLVTRQKEGHVKLFY